MLTWLLLSQIGFTDEIRATSTSVSKDASLLVLNLSINGFDLIPEVVGASSSNWLLTVDGEDVEVIESEIIVPGGPLNIAFLVDNSGSMNERADAGKKKSELVKEFIIKVFNALSVDDTIQLFYFDNRLHDPILRSGHYTREELLDGYDSIRFTGNKTNILDALDAFGTKLFTQGARGIKTVIITDGLDTGSDATKSEAINQLKRFGNTVFLFIVREKANTGEFIGFAGALAQLTNGKAKEICGSSDLESAAMLLLEDRTDYELRLTIPPGFVSTRVKDLKLFLRNDSGLIPVELPGKISRFIPEDGRTVKSQPAVSTSLENNGGSEVSSGRETPDTGKTGYTNVIIFGVILVMAFIAFIMLIPIFRPGRRSGKSRKQNPAGLTDTQPVEGEMATLLSGPDLSSDDAPTRDLPQALALVVVSDRMQIGINAADGNGQSRQNIDYAWGTSVGLRREENQDNCGATESESKEKVELKGSIFVVADGVGGYEGGAMAARLAVERICDGFIESENTESSEALLSRLVGLANSDIYDFGMNHPDGRQESSTTVVAMILRNGSATVAHAGDSRAYLFRDGELRRLTHDHSVVQEYVDQNLLTEKEAFHSPERNIITNFLGIADIAHPDILRDFSLHVGDLILISTDGLHDELYDDTIAEILSKGGGSLNEIVEILITRALKAGGKDNIAVQLIRIGG